MLNIYDNNNDMQLTESQATLDTATSVHIARLHANHWDVCMPPFPFSMTLGAKQMDHRLPKRALLSSIIMLAAELGLLSTNLGDEPELLDLPGADNTDYEILSSESSSGSASTSPSVSPSPSPTPPRPSTPPAASGSQT